MDARVLDRDLPDDDDSPGTFESSSDVADDGAGQGNSIWDARQFNGKFPPANSMDDSPTNSLDDSAANSMDARAPDRDHPDDDDSPATSESSSDVVDGSAGRGNSICCIPESSLVVCLCVHYALVVTCICVS
ncbi:unnamed protein product [Linum trigynum]|uniref:Uncharacterized protein n=1 Tax=Linum trigynum TaxID=586398 RepID=A0AAV2DCH4_9ROSI